MCLSTCLLNRYAYAYRSVCLSVMGELLCAVSSNYDRFVTGHSAENMGLLNVHMYSSEVQGRQRLA